eukprot:TRINITY_DN103864_c0_g1_i1.p1 TRINITY_DN103864_c0_g1~~TRINITY_DN103864_c0_g1_i1.p1  ORF type:complete len:448 (-),score=79.23 TRINITY_DN103864_c0_g1_i1:36-1379(-)
MARLGQTEDFPEQLPELFADFFQDNDEAERSVHDRRGYSFSFALADNSSSGVNTALISADITSSGSSLVVGRLSAVLVDRKEVMQDDSDEDDDVEDSDKESESSAENFHDACENADDEVGECSKALFAADGRPRGPLRAKLDPATASGGGFLYISAVHILCQHRGKELVLDVVELWLGNSSCAWEVLFEWLHGRWVLAVISPVSALPSGTEAESISKLARYFARLGFQQVGCRRPHLSYWFLEAGSRRTSLQAEAWKSKDEVAKIEVFIEEPCDALEGIDVELRNVCLGATEGASRSERLQPCPLQVRTLIERGADASRSDALQICAANSDVVTLRLLLDLGARVNCQDKRGNTALHVAASSGGKDGMLSVVSLLLAQGACLDAFNEEGLTPLECVRTARRDALVFRKTAGIPKRRFACRLLPFDRCISLLSNFVQQPECSKRTRIQ